MSIVSSAIVEDHAQIDGRRSIIEHHTDDQGVVYAVFYLAEAEAVVEEMLPIRAALLEAALAEQAARREAQTAADQLRAVELLKLSDESIGAILQVPVDAVADEKAKLEAQASDKDGGDVIGDVVVVP